MSREKILKTSTSTTPCANWNVNRLFDRLSDDLDKRHNRRLFHQLFHRLRCTKNCTRSAGWTHKLGHLRTYWGLQNRVNDLLHVAPLYLLLRQHLKQRCRPPSGWCLPNVLPGVHRKVPGTSRLGGRHAPERGRVVHLAVPPRPLPSSVSVELSGAYTRQRPGRSRLLLMPPSNTQSSPSPTLGSTPRGLPDRVHRDR